MKTGVIGLGAMGTGMAYNLHKAGYLSAVWNRSHNKASEFNKETGVVVAGSPADLAKRCQLIICCVSKDDDVLEMVRAVTEGVGEGCIVVDTSTVSADTAKTAAEALAPKGAAFLDCPVSGGVEGAKKGRLAMMVGGDPEILERARPVLSAISASIVHMGPTGSGQATKAVNQIIAAGINQAVTEGLAFGAAMGLPMDKVIDIVGAGAAGNWYLDHRGRTMVAEQFKPGFKVHLHHKDLAICHDMAASINAQPLSVVEATLRDYERLMDEGHGDQDISSLYHVKKSLYP